MQSCLGQNVIHLKLHHYVPKITCVWVFLFLFYSHIIYACLVLSYSDQRNIDWLIKVQKLCIRINTYLEFIWVFFAELKLLKVKYIFSWTELLSKFGFVNENVPEELKTFFSLTNLCTHIKLLKGVPHTKS